MIASLLLVVGCNQQPSQPSQPAITEPETVREVPDTAEVSELHDDFRADSFRTPLPEGLELPFPYHRLNDNLLKAETSNPERRVYVEIRQMRPEDAEAALIGLLNQKGFSASGPDVVEGVREVILTRADGIGLTIKINPNHRKPKAPDATGTLHMVWQSV